uniref:Uncharacterized protein n=1 Tax=Leptocylindrus danicus TaxID=163516 RepID=A0A7S2LIP0_9STRA
MIDGEESLCRSNDQNNENSVPDINKFDHYIGGNIVTGDASSYCVGLDHSYITDRRGDPCSVNDEGKIVESRLNSICNDTPPPMDKDTRLILSTEEYEGMRGESLLDCSVSLKSKENFLENRNPAPLPKQIFYAKRLRMPGGRYCEKAKLSERFADIEIARTEWKEKNI